MEDSYVLQMKNPLFLDLSLWFWGMSECKPGHSIGPEVRPNYIIHCVLDGKGIFEIGDKHYDIQKGQGFLIEPETLIHYKADEKEPWTYMWIGFSGARAGKYLSDIGLSSNNPVFQCEKIEELKKIILQMFQYQNLSVANQYHLQGLLYEFLAILADGMKMDDLENDNDDNTYVRAAVNFIRNNYYRGITVAEIAEHVSVNRSYLYKLFEQTFGMSPKEFLTRFQISRAKELLTWSDITIESVAWSCGYKDALAFSKVFKKMMGVSPTTYRKEHLVRIAKLDPGNENKEVIEKMMRVNETF